MALALYSDQFWFPTGVLASAVPARVFPVGSNALAPLWADAAGTIALTNPLNTDASGSLTFYATVGEYWIHLDTEAFLVTVGMSQEQADLTTGTASGGRISINAGNPKAIDIAPLVGYIVANNSTSPALPTNVRIDFPATTVELDAAAQTRAFTWWLIDSTGAVIQQAARPDNTQRRTHLVLGATAYDPGLGAILECHIKPTILPQVGNQLADLMDALGVFSVTGNTITPNGANLMLNKGAGTMFARAFSHFSGATVTNDPHIAHSPAQTPAQFRYGTRVTGSPPPVVTLVDPANYDVGGVVTPVGGGAGTSTVQRVWLFHATTPVNELFIQYGQATYSSLSAATAAIGAGTFVPNPDLEADATLIAYLAVIRTATDLSNTSQAVITKAGKFATP